MRKFEVRFRQKGNPYGGVAKRFEVSAVSPRAAIRSFTFDPKAPSTDGLTWHSIAENGVVLTTLAQQRVGRHNFDENGEVVVLGENW